MRISDWSSDVCSSDLARAFVQLFNREYDETQSAWADCKFDSVTLLIADEQAKTRCIYVAELGAASATTPREVHFHAQRTALVCDCLPRNLTLHTASV